MENTVPDFNKYLEADISLALLHQEVSLPCTATLLWSSEYTKGAIMQILASIVGAVKDPNAYLSFQVLLFLSALALGITLPPPYLPFL